MDWTQSIQRALSYIEDHLLDDDLDNESVAKHSYSSNANFQHIFSIVTGVTVGDYNAVANCHLLARILPQRELKLTTLHLNMVMIHLKASPKRLHVIMA